MMAIMKSKSKFKKYFLAQFPWVPYLFFRYLPLPYAFKINGGGERKRARNIAIEAGIRGWNSIEFKELNLSSLEYFGTENVIKVVIEDANDYVSQVKYIVKKYKPSYYLYDPRTGSQKFFGGLYQAVKIALIFHFYGVTPIAYITDISLRKHRSQAALITAKRGVVVCFMESTLVSKMFPHNRIIGPSIMPFSIQTMNHLEGLIAENSTIGKSKISFTGSLYEPRTSTLNEISFELKKHGIELEIQGRVMGGKRVPDDEYWLKIINSKIVITTADQNNIDNGDWNWVPQMVYRYLEATICGSVLLAPDVPGVNKYFCIDEEFISYKTKNDAVVKVINLLRDEPYRSMVAKRGLLKARSLVNTHRFWREIDNYLKA